jgi:hypothetical protein
MSLIKDSLLLAEKREQRQRTEMPSNMSESKYQEACLGCDLDHTTITVTTAL